MPPLETTTLLNTSSSVGSTHETHCFNTQWTASRCRYSRTTL